VKEINVLDKKKGKSLLHDVEKAWIEYITPKVPKFIEGYHLTLSTILWSGLILLFSYLARRNIQWLWGASLMIIMHYITDSLDGAVGRYRGTGIIKWGFFMDHLLDYLFLASILAGYSFLFRQYITLHFFTLIVFTLFMINSYLSLAAKGEFEITFMGFGPTEIRILFILINTALIIFGRTYLGRFTPYILAVSFVILIIYVYFTQKELWKIDMENKNNIKKK
jgi:archaetidylinositol phosphate synthase